MQHSKIPYSEFLHGHQFIWISFTYSNVIKPLDIVIFFVNSNQYRFSHAHHPSLSVIYICMLHNLVLQWLSFLSLFCFYLEFSLPFEFNVPSSPKEMIGYCFHQIVQLPLLYNATLSWCFVYHGVLCENALWSILLQGYFLSHFDSPCEEQLTSSPLIDWSIPFDIWCHL